MRRYRFITGYLLCVLALTIVAFILYGRLSHFLWPLVAVDLYISRRQLQAAAVTP